MRRPNTALFVLLEAFDAADLHAARELLAARTPAGAGSADILLGINSRDLQTLQVVPERFEALAPRLPGDRPAVAESGVASRGRCRAHAALGVSGWR